MKDIASTQGIHRNGVNKNDMSIYFKQSKRYVNLFQALERGHEEANEKHAPRIADRSEYDEWS